MHPSLFKFIKSGKKRYENTQGLNIRNSSFLKSLVGCRFKIHNGKQFYENDPVSLAILLKSYPFYNFKLGQFSSTRQELNRRGNDSGIIIISEDLKKKKGVFIKNKNKKKRFVFKKRK